MPQKLKRNLLHWAVCSALIGLGLLLTSPTADAQGQPGISSPAPGSSVSGSVPVMGTAVGEPFARYELFYKQEPSGDEGYVWFTGDTRQVNGGQLGVWQTGDLPPGTYTLRMRIVRPDGNYGEHFAPNISVNQSPPTPTPTETPDEPTATPIPINTPTPIPQPTVAPVEVEQPNLAEPAANDTATPTPERIALGTSGDSSEAQQPAAQADVAPASEPGVEIQPAGVVAELSAALALDRLRDRFFTGVRWSAGLFLLLGALFAAKRLLEWVLAKAG